MRFLAALAALVPALFAGCGGGYVSIGYGFGSGFDDVSFITWSGSANGDHVVDVNNHAFGFYSDNGCLYNFQTGRENTSFCLAPGPGPDTVVFGAFRMRIANIRSSTGTCIAALLDESTGNFIDIELDQRGREVVAITAMRPVSCLA